MLQIRARERKAAEQALAEAKARAALAEARLAEAVRARRCFEEQLEHRRSKGMPAWQWHVTCQEDQRLKEAEEAAAALLKAAQAEVAARLEALVTAKRREEVLKKLKERRWADYCYEVGRAEQAETDEIARNVAARRRGVG